MDREAIIEAKRALRERALGAIRAMTPEARASASERICEEILATPAFADAETVVAFWPLTTEPDVREVARAGVKLGKRVCFPRVMGDRLEIVRVDSVEDAGARSSLGVWEPVGGEVIDPAGAVMVLAPGVAFDRRGGRVGRAKGYFDRFLEGRDAGWRVCGVCFACALADAVPVERHDAMMDAVVTERGMIGIRPEKGGVWETRRPDR